jgi:beta-glucanase (GH16 family)
VDSLPPRRPILRYSLGAVALVCAALSLAQVSPQPTSRSILDLSGYNLTFDESFDELSISAWGPGTRWIAHTPWNGDFGDAQFVDPAPEFPFTTEHGVLRIEARRGADGRWRSGLIASTDPSGNGFSQKFGYFEMRARLPKGPGLWPAFWLIANKQEHTSAEIDVMEHYGKFPDMYESVVHVWKKTELGRSYQALFRHGVPSGSLYDGFHTYGVSVEPDWTIFFFDRQETARTPTPPEHHQPMFMLANLAMGAGWPIDETPSPSFMYIDYIRAYQKHRTNQTNGLKP